jgi:Tol biopolymer transport system component
LAEFSPDGKYVATLEYGTDATGLIRPVIKLTAVDGSDSFELAMPQRAADFEAVPGTDDLTFVDGSDPQRNLQRVKIVAGSKPEPFTKLTEGPITDHAWSKDGKKLIASRRLADGENVWLMNTDGTPARQLTHFTGYDVLQMEWGPADATVVVNAGQVSNDVVVVRNFK